VERQPGRRCNDSKQNDVLYEDHALLSGRLRGSCLEKRSIRGEDNRPRGLFTMRTVRTQRDEVCLVAGVRDRPLTWMVVGRSSGIGRMAFQPGGKTGCVNEKR